MGTTRRFTLVGTLAAALLLAAIACAPGSETSGPPIPSSTSVAPIPTDSPVPATPTPRPTATVSVQVTSTGNATPGPGYIPPWTPSPLPSPTTGQPSSTAPTPTHVPPTPTIGPSTPTPLPAIVACGSGPVLTHAPMDIGTVTYISPLGALNPPGHTFPTSHMYFMLPSENVGGNAGPFGDGRVFPAQPVYAAADGYVSLLASGTVTTSLSGSSTTFEEFDLRLEVCDGIVIRYGHIGPLSPRLQELLENTAASYCHSYTTGPDIVERCEYQPFWTVEPGELLAYTSGRVAALDFGAAIPVQVSPDRTGNEVTYSCPLDLYGDSLRLQFEALLGDNLTRRTAEPVCGNLDVDINGTAAGRWYFDLNGPPQEDLNVAFVYDNVFTEIPVLSIGTSVSGVSSAAHQFTPVSSGSRNRTFDAITPGAGVFCFDSLADRFGRQFPGVAILAELFDDNTLRVEKAATNSCGTGPWTMTAAATTFTR